MGQIIIIRPGQEPTTADCHVPLRLEDLHRTIGADTLDGRGLGDIPPRGTRVQMWVDDIGLMRDEALPNRRLPGNGYIICGTIVLCALHGEDDVGLEQDEVAFLLADIAERWEKLAPDMPKPEPSFTVTPLDR